MGEQLALPVRLLLLGAGALSAIAGPILFLFPRDTAVYFAWTIQHPLTPVFMGASYTTAAVGLFLSLQSNCWSVARVLMPAVIVFATTQLLATLLHLNIFNWSHPVAWAWLAVYIVSPLAGAAVFAFYERGHQAESNGAPPGRSLAIALSSLAVAYALVGLALFLFPQLVAPLWPWSLTPLTARVIGGWVLTVASLAWMVGRQRGLGMAYAVLVALVVLPILLLIGALWHSGEFNGPPPSILVYLMAQVVLLGLSAFGTWRFARSTA